MIGLDLRWLQYSLLLIQIFNANFCRILSVFQNNLLEMVLKYFFLFNKDIFIDIEKKNSHRNYFFFLLNYVTLLQYGLK